MAKRNDIEQMDYLVRVGKKYMRIDEAKEYFSVGRHTIEKWAKQAKANYKINGVKLISIEKIEKFIEAFEEVDPLVVIKNAAHNSNDDKPEEVNKIIEDFLLSIG